MCESVSVYLRECECVAFFIVKHILWDVNVLYGTINV